MGRLCVVLLVIFSYPLQSHPSRRCAMTLIEQLQHYRARREGFASPAEAEAVVLKARYWGFTACFLLFSLCIALAVDDLGAVLAVVGATGSTVVSLILPGICYFRFFPHPHAVRWLALAVFLLGCAVMPVALVSIFAL